MRRTIIPAVVLIAVAVAACGGDSAATFDEVAFDGDTALYGEGGAEEPDPGDDADRLADVDSINLEIAVSADRKVIRNVSLQLEADDTRATYDEIVAIAERSGGFVSGAEVSPADEGQEPLIRLTVRVPSNSLSSVLGEIKDAAAEVISESQGTQDVTEQFIDLEAQLTNLTLLETELRLLLEEVRQQPDADPTKLLQVFTEISSTRGEIERIQGQLNYLEDAVDLATVAIAIAPTPEAVPLVEESWAPGETVRDSVRDLVAGLQSLVDAVITFAIAVLPMVVIVLAIPGVALFLAFRAWRSRRKAVGSEPVPSE